MRKHADLNQLPSSTKIKFEESDSSSEDSESFSEDVSGFDDMWFPVK